MAVWIWVVGFKSLKVQTNKSNLGGGTKRNGDDRVLEELALDRRYLQVNVPERSNLIGKSKQT